MWWSDAKPRRFALVLAAGLALLSLSACGFRPLYGASESGAATRLGNIRVQPIADRSGQLVHNSLTDLISPMPDGGPQYDLTVKVSHQTSAVTISSDGRANRSELVQISNFVLTDAAGAAVYSGTTRTVAAHDVSNQYFSSTVSERDALQRASRQTAEQIMAQLAAHFAK